jgi:hypothetical protein
VSWYLSLISSSDELLPWVVRGCTEEWPGRRIFGLLEVDLETRMPGEGPSFPVEICHNRDPLHMNIARRGVQLDIGCAVWHKFCSTAAICLQE